MTKDEALRMAIEAMIYHIEQTRSITRTYSAINACKEALAQPVQNPLSDEEIINEYQTHFKLKQVFKNSVKRNEFLEFARAIEKRILAR